MDISFCAEYIRIQRAAPRGSHITGRTTMTVTILEAGRNNSFEAKIPIGEIVQALNELKKRDPEFYHKMWGV